MAADAHTIPGIRSIHEALDLPLKTLPDPQFNRGCVTRLRSQPASRESTKTQRQHITYKYVSNQTRPIILKHIRQISSQETAISTNAADTHDPQDSKQSRTT
ncbi:hypothetical protein CEXT_2921 [Caerostris extrusa]|uniref:DET1- and DDB1-associated protein 1 n=1 Tax=Caerostris extrusa TaxID=172846 RepID=A0AAV4VHR1_CAEEX|nr:hypothetical protein CEXT_2921 [Caerostris extrusa]